MWVCLIYVQEDLPRLTEIENGLAIFCVATYGEGDPTDNAQEFYEWLQTGDIEVTGMKYAVSMASCGAQIVFVSSFVLLSYI